MRICTVHLESLDFSAPLRKKQLNTIFPLLEEDSSTPIQHSFFAGDFNFCSKVWYRKIYRVILSIGSLSLTNLLLIVVIAIVIIL